MSQVGTFGGQLVENCVRDEFNWQFDVAQRWPEADGNQRKKRLQRSHVKAYKETILTYVCIIDLFHQPDTSGLNETFFHNFVSYAICRQRRQTDAVRIINQINNK